MKHVQVVRENGGERNERLRIIGTSDGLHWLQRKFLGLASKEVGFALFIEISFARNASMQRARIEDRPHSSVVRFLHGLGGNSDSPGIFIAESDSRVTVEWRATADQWEEYVDLIAPVVARGGSCVLHAGPADEVEIVVERDDAVSV